MEEKQTQPKTKNLKNLRTYTSDMADAIRTNEASVIKIALAEKEKREQEYLYRKAEGTKTSKILLTVGGIILIVAAIVGSYFLIQKKKEKDTPTPIINNVETFITYDSKSYLDVTNATSITDLSKIIDNDLTPNSGLIKALFFIKKTGETQELLTLKNFFSLIRTSAPGPLTRSLSDKYLVGEYANKNAISRDDESVMFMIFQTNDYSQTYASMLEWEKTMLRDLHVLFKIDVSNEKVNLFSKPWKDVIINNRDARVLYGENGEEVLYYVFVNKNDFIITKNIEALKEITERLLTKNASSQ